MSPAEPEIPDTWLEGLHGEARLERRRLLERLLADGHSREEVEQALADDRLALLPVSRVLGAESSAREIQAQTGVPAAIVARYRRLQGLPEPDPDDRVFTAADAEAARALGQFLDAGFTEEALGETAMVLGEGMARLATTIVDHFTQTFLHENDSEAAVAERFAAVAAELMPRFEPILVAAFTAQLRAAVSRGVIGQAELESGRRAAAQHMAVCFVDLVGFTRLGARLGVLELSTVAGDLARLAAAHADPPVRLIKTIGDAAMFVSPDVEAMVDAAISLLAAAEAQELPSLRAGIAYGLVTDRAGDYYGNAVNLASRVTGVARPDSVLCTQEVVDRCPETVRFSPAGRHRLKGVSRPVALHRARLATS